MDIFLLSSRIPGAFARDCSVDEFRPFSPVFKIQSIVEQKPCKSAVDMA